MFLSIEQNTPAWLEWRTIGLGGSDAPAVAGFWGDFRATWAFKAAQYRGEKPKGKKSTPAMAWGHEHEDAARQLYCDLTGNTVQPVCCTSDARPFIKASLDGWNDAMRLVLEIKSPFTPARHRVVLDAGKIPDYYYPQVQHQLYAAGGASAHFISYNPREEGPDRLAFVEVERDDDYIEVLMAMEEEFWAHVTHSTPPTLDAAGCELLARLYQMNHLKT